MIPNSNVDNFLKMEYPTLREEVMQLTNIRQKIMQLSITIGAALIGIALTKSDMFMPSLALIYPPIGACLALGWKKYDSRLDILKEYIKQIESRFLPNSKLGWEHFRFHWLKKSSYGSSTLSQFLVLLAMQILSIFVGFSMYNYRGIWDHLGISLLIIDIMSILFMLYLVSDKIKKLYAISKLNA
jgi:hypothetical protein